MSHIDVIPLYNKRSSKACRTVNKILTCNWALRNGLYIGSTIVFVCSVIGFFASASVHGNATDSHPYDATAHFFFGLGAAVLIPWLLNLLYLTFGKVKFILFNSYSHSSSSGYILRELSLIERNLYKLRRSIGKNAYAKTYVDKALRAIWEIIDESRKYANLTAALKLSSNYDKNKPLQEYKNLADEIEATTSLLVFRSISLNDSAHLQVVAMELQHCIDSVDELSALHLAA